MPWLEAILEALLQRAVELELAPGDGSSAGALEPSSALASRWQELFGRLHAVLLRHVAALHEAHAAGKALGDSDGCAEVRGLLPIGLVRTLLPHCGPAAHQELRSLLVDFGA